MSAVVLAALVIMWAVVLVPMFLRRHERANELASADRFAGAMRVLSRRRGPGHAPVDAEQRAAVIGAALAGLRPPPRPLTTQHDRAEARMAAARRSLERESRLSARRRGLMLMVGLVAVTAVLAVALGGAWVWVQVFVDLVALSGLAQLRATALADRARRTRPVWESPAARPFPARPVEIDEGDADAVPVRTRRQIVFDAVSEMPIVSRPRLRPTAVREAAAVAETGPIVLSPAGFRDDPDAPPQAERVAVPVAEVEEPITEGIELEQLRRASGE